MSRSGQHRAHELLRRQFPAPDVAEGECEGVVVDVQRGDLHTVDVTIGETTRRVLATRAGRLASRHIRLLAGDRCVVQVNAYDPARGRIVRRIDPPKGAA